MIKTIATIIINIIFALLLIPSTMSAMMSPMMFDAPGTTEDPLMWIAFLANLSFPVVIVCSIVLSIIFHIARKKDHALGLSLLPFINIILFFGSILLIDFISS